MPQRRLSADDRRMFIAKFAARTPLVPVSAAAAAAATVSAAPPSWGYGLQTTEKSKFLSS